MREPGMTMLDCEREAEVFDAICSGYWPDAVHQHIRDCPVCRDLAAVAVPLRRDHDEATSGARVPTAGQVWWRATMRRRAEAAAAASKPITWIQGIAGACAAGACAAVFTLAWPTAARPVVDLMTMLGLTGVTGMRIDATVAPIGTVAMTVRSLAILGGAGLILAPVVFYLVLSDE